VIELDSLAKYHYEGDDNEDQNEENDQMLGTTETPYVPPFELFITSI